MGLGKQVRSASGPEHDRAISTLGGFAPYPSVEGALLATPGAGAPYEVSGNSYISVYRGIMSLPGFWRGANLLADLIGGVPWDAYSEGEDQDELVTPRPLLLEQPSPPDTQMTTMSSLALDLVIDGNALALIADRDGTEVTAIAPQPAAWCGVRRDPETRRVQYYTPEGIFDQSDVLHIKGPTVPGQLWGMGVLEAHFWTTLRLARDLNRQAGDVSLNAVPTGVLQAGNADMNEREAERLKSRWQRAMMRRTIAVVGSNDKFTPLSWNPKDSQLIEARQFSLLEIALILGIPPRYLGASGGDSMTYSNSETEALDLLKFSLRGHLIRMEQAFSLCLPRGTKVVANLDDFLRPDTVARYSAYSSGISAGWLRRSEVRKQEKLTPVPGIDDQPMPAGIQLKLNKEEPVTEPALLQPRLHGSEPANPEQETARRAVSKLPFGPGSHLWEYWLHGGGASWRADPHPWTALHRALEEHAVKGGLSPTQVDGLTTNLYFAAFHHYPPHNEHGGVDHP